MIWGYPHFRNPICWNPWDVSPSSMEEIPGVKSRDDGGAFLCICDLSPSCQSCELENEEQRSQNTRWMTVNAFFLNIWYKTRPDPFAVLWKKLTNIWTWSKVPTFFALTSMEAGVNCVNAWRWFSVTRLGPGWTAASRRKRAVSRHKKGLKPQPDDIDIIMYIIMSPSCPSWKKRNRRSSGEDCDCKCWKLSRRSSKLSHGAHDAMGPMGPHGPHGHRRRYV